jgi:hypothetical protein
MEDLLRGSGLEMPRVSKITTFDFLNLKRNPKVSKLILVQKETGIPLMFSDYMYTISLPSLEKKEKRILYITEYSIHILHPTTYQALRITPLTDLQSIVIVQTSGALTLLRFEKSYHFP